MVTFSFFPPSLPVVWDRAQEHVKDVAIPLTESTQDAIDFVVMESEGDGGAWSAIKELYDELFPGREKEEWPEHSYERANFEWTVVCLMVMAQYKREKQLQRL